jgi:hypothetical protein
MARITRISTAYGGVPAAAAAGPPFFCCSGRAAGGGGPAEGIGPINLSANGGGRGPWVSVVVVNALALVLGVMLVPMPASIYRVRPSIQPHPIKILGVGTKHRCEAAGRDWMGMSGWTDTIDGWG